MTKIKTIQYDVPYTFENSSNPWIMDPKNDKDVIELNGNKITAEYMWSLNTNDRNKLLKDVFNYYRNNGFPYEKYDDKFLLIQFDKFVKAKSESILTKEGYISNYGSTCLNVCRHFCWDKFWKASSETMKSIEDVFYDDELFKKVLKNRMGWNVSNEGGETRPYMFAISDAMIRTGIRNSGQGYGVSNFRPMIAKYFYEQYAINNEHTPTIYDFSGGWGARALAALSLNYNYIGVDPLTSDNINKLIDFYKCKSTSDAKCYNMCSQDQKLYKILPDNIDLAFSCPPYFNLEVYSDDETQSYNEFNNYETWLEQYWRPTIQICYNKLKSNGYFIFIIKDSYGKLNLKDGMEKVVLEEGFVFEQSYQYNTSTNHLSGKVKTGRVKKNNEYVLIYKKL